MLALGLTIWMIGMPGPVQAQVVEQERSDVTFRVVSAAGEAVPAATVRLVDESGSVVVQGSTDPEGNVTLRLREAGEYVIEVERIGYEAWRSEPRALTPSMDPVTLTLTTRPLRLPDLLAMGERRCANPVEEGGELARLIELTRSLLSEVVATERRFPRFHARVVSEEPERPRARYQVYDTLHLDLYRREQSADPRALVEQGFIEPRASWRDQPEFHAVTPEVAMSDAFIQSRCFDALADPDSGWVGLAFEPVPGADRFDVRGAIWMDTLELRPIRIEFHYTNLDDFLWDHELPAVNRARSARMSEWGEDIGAVATRRGWARARARRHSGDYHTRRITTHQMVGAVREEDFGGRMDFEPFMGGWVTSRAKLRWPGLSGGFATFADFHVTAGYLFGSELDSRRVLHFAQELERLGLVAPVFRLRHPLPRWHPLPAAVREPAAGPLRAPRRPR